MVVHGPFSHLRAWWRTILVALAVLVSSYAAAGARAAVLPNTYQPVSPRVLLALWQCQPAITVTSAANLVENELDCPGAVTADPNLDLLANNGGPTLTMALTQGSPAVNAGDNAGASGLTTDQRGAGFPRIRGLIVDIGAFERCILSGDVNADGIVNVLDLQLIAGAWLTSNPVYDINGSGRVDILDIMIAAAEFGQGCGG